MSNPADRPWTEEERYALLTEILKKAGIPSSHLVRMINEFRINPNWDDIPLPQGRSLNSCKMAFFNMQHQGQQKQPTSHPPAPPILRPEMSGTSAPIDPMLRKRPLFPAEKPFAPRPIQPRPPASTASYSSESSAQLSPRFDVSGEPPRKRGRPSKAETERRKAAAEARGEPYPPPRRSNSGRLKVPSPSSPAAPLIAPYPGPPAASTYDIPARQIASGPPGGRDMLAHNMGMGMRELPRPQEMPRLPSPHALQLGPPDSFTPRLNSTSERGSFSAIPDRFSSPDGRRDSVTSRGDPPYEGRTSTTPGEKR